MGFLTPPAMGLNRGLSPRLGNWRCRDIDTYGGQASETTPEDSTVQDET